MKYKIKGFAGKLTSWGLNGKFYYKGDEILLDERELSKHNDIILEEIKDPVAHVEVDQEEHPYDRPVTGQPKIQAEKPKVSTPSYGSLRIKKASKK